MIYVRLLLSCDNAERNNHGKSYHRKLYPLTIQRSLPLCTSHWGRTRGTRRYCLRILMSAWPSQTKKKSLQGHAYLRASFGPLSTPLASEDILTALPFGCRTGFHLLCWGHHDPRDVAKALKEALELIVTTKWEDAGNKGKRMRQL